MGVVQIQADIQDKHKHNHEPHMKAQTSRQQADIQDTRRQTSSKHTYKTQEGPLQIQECIGAYKTQGQDRLKKTTTYTRMHRGNHRQHKHCNKIAYIDVHACKQTHMFTSCP